MAIPPFVLYAFLLASVLGMAFFIFFGRGWWQLASYWFAAVIGFALGQWLGMTLGINFFPFGQLNTVEGSLTSLVALMVMRTVWQEIERLVAAAKDKQVKAKR